MIVPVSLLVKVISYKTELSRQCREINFRSYGLATCIFKKRLARIREKLIFDAPITHTEEALYKLKE